LLVVVLLFVVELLAAGIVHLCFLDNNLVGNVDLLSLVGM
jgi:hypothetical protein